MRPPVAFRIAQTARLTDWPNQRGEFDTLVDGIIALLGKKESAESMQAKADERKSIAVLPFVNMSNDPEQEYFSDGISEELINALVRVPQLEVTARMSSFQFKSANRDIREVGRQLGVSHLLEGSVRKAGNRIRVTAQLISVASGNHLWSERFDRELIDIFEVQDEITAEIVKALHGTLAGDELPATKPAVNVEAYNAYLRGLYHANRTEFSKAIEAFRKAIAIDATFADAYVQLAGTYDFQNYLDPDSVDQETIDRCVARALELDPDNPSLAIVPAMDLLCRLIYLKRTHANQSVEELLESIALDSDNRLPLNRVLIAAARGDVDEALQAFSDGFESGDVLAFKMSTPPKYAEDSFGGIFPEFYNHPGFAEVLQRFGLDQDSLARITVPTLPW